jgi:dTDP-4-dehydrorhamnose 3,5-epimerase-like enzyme
MIAGVKVKKLIRHPDDRGFFQGIYVQNPPRHE